jgi:hypothetical protein
MPNPGVVIITASRQPPGVPLGRNSLQIGFRLGVSIRLGCGGGNINSAQRNEEIGGTNWFPFSFKGMRCSSYLLVKLSPKPFINSFIDPFLLPRKKHPWGLFHDQFVIFSGTHAAGLHHLHLQGVGAQAPAFDTAQPGACISSMRNGVVHARPRTLILHVCVPGVPKFGAGARTHTHAHTHEPQGLRGSGAI